jgi:hypothetical protein
MDIDFMTPDDFDDQFRPLKNPRPGCRMGGLLFGTRGVRAQLRPVTAQQHGLDSDFQQHFDIGIPHLLTGWATL